MNRTHLVRALLATVLLNTSCFAADEYYTAYELYSSHGYDAARLYYRLPRALAYQYDYCIHYTGERYIYYYNPTTRLFWAAYDLESKGFSLLAPKDQKGRLKDIPQAAYPAPAPGAFHPATGDPIPTPPNPPTRPR